MTNRVQQLTTAEADALKQLHRQTKDANVRSRCEMILLSAEGLSSPQISERVRFSGRTVRRYLARYEAEGLEGLLRQSPPGRPPRVTLDYLHQLEAVVERMPRDLNLAFSNWTTANLAAYMAQQTGIGIGARQLENYLKKHRWRLRRPLHSIKHLQDPALVAEKKSDPGTHRTSQP